MSTIFTTGIHLAEIIDFKFSFWLKRSMLCMFFGTMFLWPSVHAQFDPGLAISFRADNEKLSSVLNRLSSTYKLNFSYNPGEKSFDALVNYNTVNKPLETVLKEILALTNHDFRVIGSQIVIYNLVEEPGPPQTTTRPTRPPPQHETEQTLPRTDTLILRDTIFRVDTLILRDTVFVEKEPPRTTKPERPSPLREDLFRFEPDRNNGWSIMPFYKHMISFQNLRTDEDDQLLRLAEEAETVSWINQSIGAEARFSQNRWHATSGLQYTRFTSRFTYDYELFEGGFFRTDTIDSYYTLPQTDTIWHYVTDSIWVPLSSREFSFNRFNRICYLEIPLAVGYNIYSDANFRLWVNAGINLGLLTNKNGMAIGAGLEYAGVEFDDLDFSPLVLSYSLATGVRYKISEWVDISAELGYRQQINAILKDFPLQRRIGAAGIKLGLIYYL